MENVTIACMQPRFEVVDSREQVEALCRRFLRQAKAKSAQLAVLPELTGLLLVPSLIPRIKLGLAQRSDRGRKPGAGLFARGVGRVADATAGALGGGMLGSVKRLVAKGGHDLLDLYLDTFGGLAREFAMALVPGSLYVYDTESGTVRNRAYLLDATGVVVGYQDKMHLSPDEQDLADAGAEMTVLPSRWGRLGILLGRDAVVPELSRLLALQGADLIAGVAACPGVACAHAVRSALALRAEENHVYVAASFLVGADLLGGRADRDYLGRSAILAPAELGEKGDGVLAEVGSSITEGVIVHTLSSQALDELRQGSALGPRRQLNLGTQGSTLAQFYARGLGLDEAIQQGLVPAAAPNAGASGDARLQPEAGDGPVAAPKELAV